MRVMNIISFVLKEATDFVKTLIFAFTMIFVIVSTMLILLTYIYIAREHQLEDLDIDDNARFILSTAITSFDYTNMLITTAFHDAKNAIKWRIEKWLDWFNENF